MHDYLHLCRSGNAGITNRRGAWTEWSLLLLVIAMIASGCLILEVLRRYPPHTSITSITQDILGSRIAFITNITVYFLGGVLLCAYMTSSGLLINEFLGFTAGAVLSSFICVGLGVFDDLTDLFGFDNTRNVLSLICKNNGKKR